MFRAPDHFRPDFSALLVGTAVGDAIGLPREGLRPERATALFGGPPLRHALLPGVGLTSDDTEHACLTASALLVAHDDPQRFERALGWRLRWWFVALPPGVGLATARACLKLLVGFPPSRSGVFSAGNGPAMRAPILGAYFRDDLPLLKDFVRVSTRITHTHPDAEDAAIAIALAATLAVPTPGAMRSLLETHLRAGPARRVLLSVCDAVERNESFGDFLAEQKLTRGISGYILHTAPAVLFCYLTWPTDYRKGVESIIAAGGDTDTTGAILGALIAARMGESAIPREWVSGLRDFPRSRRYLRRLGRAMQDHVPPPLLFWPLIPLRNLGLLGIVLLHGFRRLLPPYARRFRMSRAEHPPS